MSLIQQLAQRYRFFGLREIRISHRIYNFLKRKNLAYLRSLYRDVGLKKSAISSVCNNDFREVRAEPHWLDVEDSADVLKNHSTFRSLDWSHQEALKDWSKKGYARLRGFYDEKTIDEIVKINDELWDSNKGKWRFGDRRVRIAFENEKLYDFATNEKLVEILNMLLGKEVELFNTINFRQGDEQPIHSDSFYMTTFPLGGLIGIWIALEDIHPDAAPLRFYPGSHTLPYILNDSIDNLGNRWRVGRNGEEKYEQKIQDLIRIERLEEKVYLPKKGDVLMWHANLLHGGSKKMDPNRSRKSMVCHFTTKQTICYHENMQRPAVRPNRMAG